MLKVVKFGGSSVAGAHQFQKVKNIVLSDPARRVVVVSAAGKRSADDHKLTDLLYLCHAHLTYGVPCDSILQTIQDRFAEIRSDLGLTKEKHTTSDMLFTLETVSCLGACGLAPVVMVNDTVYPSMTPDAASELLIKLREEA